MNNTRTRRQLDRRDRNKLENVEGQLNFRIKKQRLGIEQRSIQCATLTDQTTTTLRVAGMPAGSPQDTDHFATSATTMIISSTSTADTLAGTGCRRIFIRGLDANFNKINEQLNMNGQTGATTVKSYLRVNKIFTESVGSAGNNVGDVYVSQTGLSTLTAGIPANGEIIRAMYATTNFDTMGIYTVPAGHFFAYQMLNSYSDATQSKPILILQESIIPNTNGDERIRYKVGELWTTGDISWDATGSLEEFAKTDMIFSVRTNTGTASVNYYNEYCLIPDSLVATHG